ncbi:hypothetical protein CWI37_0559p0010 [Hamiltosporidium tvaerminnensis]|uniref:Uncharacterized protein n=1 Tax=Hamiltosporidium tvaerminnensis TaxID=1176355 RepID=A0A4Q9L3M5_9MICR|nr:hypothetical protein CWI37_0559p0010 [Hamiltosporidium tvaerminnensis]
MSIHIPYFILFFKTLHFSNLNIEEAYLNNEETNKYFENILENKDKINKGILWMQNFTQNFLIFKDELNEGIIKFYHFSNEDLENKLDPLQKIVWLADLNTFLDKFQKNLDDYYRAMNEFAIIYKNIENLSTYVDNMAINLPCNLFSIKNNFVVQLIQTKNEMFLNLCEILNLLKLYRLEYPLSSKIEEISSYLANVLKSKQRKEMNLSGCARFQLKFKEYLKILKKLEINIQKYTDFIKNSYYSFDFEFLLSQKNHGNLAQDLLNQINTLNNLDSSASYFLTDDIEISKTFPSKYDLDRLNFFINSAIVSFENTFFTITKKITEIQNIYTFLISTFFKCENNLEFKDKLLILNTSEFKNSFLDFLNQNILIYKENYTSSCECLVAIMNDYTIFLNRIIKSTIMISCSLNPILKSYIIKMETSLNDCLKKIQEKRKEFYHFIYTELPQNFFRIYLD